MIEYLQKFFGDKIELADYKLPKNTPIYLSKGYDVNKLKWGDSECVVITPHDVVARLPVLKKHYQSFKSICNLPCVLNLSKLTSEQRVNLVLSNIPFISIQQQIYLPFWGSIFLDKLRNEVVVPKKMTPTTQLVFLHVFYRLFNGEQNINSTSIVSLLGIPKSSVSRAVTELETYGLLKFCAEGTNKWLKFTSDSSNVLKKAIDIMRSPISRIVYLKQLQEGIQYKYGGVNALSMISMLSANERDGAIVFSKENTEKIEDDNIISKRNFDDFGGVVCEVWIYDPKLLSDYMVVDDISLLLCFKGNTDERVQDVLDKVRKKYGLN